MLHCSLPTVLKYWLGEGGHRCGCDFSNGFCLTFLIIDFDRFYISISTRRAPFAVVGSVVYQRIRVKKFPRSKNAQRQPSTTPQSTPPARCKTTFNRASCVEVASLFLCDTEDAKTRATLTLKEPEKRDKMSRKRPWLWPVSETLAHTGSKT
eukprot:g24524.t1